MQKRQNENSGEFLLIWETKDNSPKSKSKGGSTP